MPKGSAPYQDGWDPPGQTQMSYLYAPGPESGRVKDTLWEVSLDVGQRIRTTVSWNGCADDPTGAAPGSVAVDFDLFLFHLDSDTYVWASQSIFDNNEGLDYTVQPGEAGKYEVMLVWPKDSKSCEGATIEPVAMHMVVW